jgi:DNA-binding LacI/PurR family transcriptional regulator
VPDPDKVTIYEVARRAGVSIATVSHVFNRPERVKSSTRERVLDAVEELGFVPKPTAVSLARKGVGRIGVLAPFTSYSSYATRLNGVLEACAGRAVEVVVFDAPSATTAESPLLRTLPTTGRLDGLVIMGLPLDDGTAARLKKGKLATVLVDSQHPEFDSVTVDDEAGGCAAGTHLVQRGYSRLVFITESVDIGSAISLNSATYASAGELRARGVVRAMKDGGLDPADLEWALTAGNIAGGRAAAAQLLDRPDPPTGFICNHDDLAAGVLAELRALGCAVPGDAAVVGYDDSELAEALDLTSVRQPFAETGRIAISLLAAVMDGTADSTQQISLKPRLTIGATT